MRCRAMATARSTTSECSSACTFACDDESEQKAHFNKTMAFADAAAADASTEQSKVRHSVLASQFSVRSERKFNALGAQKSIVQSIVQLEDNHKEEEVAETSWDQHEYNAWWAEVRVE